MLGNKAETLAPPVLLSPDRWYSHSHLYSKRGKCFSLCDPEDSQTMLPTPRSLFSFPTEAQLSLPCMNVTMARSSRISFRFCDPLLIITCNRQFLSFSQSVVLGKSFSSVIPCTLFLSLSPSVSPLYSLHNQGFLSSCSSCLSQINSLQLLSNTMSCFSTLVMQLALSVLKLVPWVFKLMI